MKKDFSKMRYLGVYAAHTLQSINPVMISLTMVKQSTEVNKETQHQITINAKEIDLGEMHIDAMVT